VVHSISLVVGALATVVLALAGAKAVAPLYNWPVVRAVLGLWTIFLSLGIPVWLIRRVYPPISNAHLLAFVATMLTLFVIIALLNMEAEF
jgi:hypothetical protein